MRRACFALSCAAVLTLFGGPMACGGAKGSGAAGDGGVVSGEDAGVFAEGWRVGGCPDWSWSNPQPQGNDLYGMWASAADDIWAVGALGTIVHYDGAAWSMSGSRAQSGTMNVLHGVWGSGATDVWAVGDRGTILHWNGKAWSDFSLPPNIDVDLESVGGSAANDVWAVGYVGDDALGSSPYGVIAHWNGTAWSVSTLPSDSGTAGSGAINGFHGVWASGPADAWIAGDSRVLHWDGRGWSSTDFSTDAGFVGFVNSVWGSGPDDVWASDNGASVFHWDGAAWSPSPSPPSTARAALGGAGRRDVWDVGTGADGTGWSMAHWDGNGWLIAAAGGTGGELLAVWESAPNDVWAVGRSGNIVHWNGLAGSPPYVSEPPLSENLTHGIWGFGSTDVWVAGDGLLAHWDGHMWSDAPQSIVDPDGGLSLSVMNFAALWGSRSDDLWAVGGVSGPVPPIQPTAAVAHWDGHAWSGSAQATVDATGVWGSGPNDVWVVGLAGTSAPEGAIIHWDGHAWSAYDLAGRGLAKAPLQGIGGTGATDVWAVGQGEILHWEGHAWSASSGATAIKNASLASVWGSGPSDAWAVGDAVFHWDGHAWSTVMPHAPAQAVLSRVWGTGPSDVWAVGNTQGAFGTAPVQQSGVVLHWDGHAWTSCVAQTGALIALWGSGPGDLWAVQWRGGILHRP